MVRVKETSRHNSIIAIAALLTFVPLGTNLSGAAMAQAGGTPSPGSSAGSSVNADPSVGGVAHSTGADLSAGADVSAGAESPAGAGTAAAASPSAGAGTRAAADVSTAKVYDPAVSVENEAITPAIELLIREYEVRQATDPSAVRTRSGKNGSAKHASAKNGSTSAKQGRIRRVAGAALHQVDRLFPNCQFFVLRYDTEHGAQADKDGRKHELFVMDETPKIVAVISDDDGLEQFFKQHLPVINNTLDATVAAMGWLCLSRQLFEDDTADYAPLTNLANKKTKTDDATMLIGSAKIEIQNTNGKEGDISVTLEFDPSGRLAKVDEDVNIRRKSKPAVTLLPQPGVLPETQ